MQQRDQLDGLVLGVVLGDDHVDDVDDVLLRWLKGSLTLGGGLTLKWGANCLGGSKL